MRLRQARAIRVACRLSARMAAVHGSDHAVRRRCRTIEEAAEPGDRRIHHQHARDARSKPDSREHPRPRLLRTRAGQVRSTPNTTTRSPTSRRSWKTALARSNTRRRERDFRRTDAKMGDAEEAAETLPVAPAATALGQFMLQLQICSAPNELRATRPRRRVSQADRRAMKPKENDKEDGPSTSGRRRSPATRSRNSAAERPVREVAARRSAALAQGRSRRRQAYDSEACAAGNLQGPQVRRDIYQRENVSTSSRRCC